MTQVAAAKPKANAICQRVIGTSRGECLDWLIPLSESPLRSILKGIKNPDIVSARALWCTSDRCWAASSRTLRKAISAQRDSSANWFLVSSQEVLWARRARFPR